MSRDELDLERGRPDEDEGKPAGGRSERSQRRDRAREREKSGNLGQRLGSIFERLAQSVEGRGDDELAAMIREDKEAMVGGLVNLTSKAPAMAPAVLAALAVLEPLIAFGRIFRLLLRRAGDRRAEAREWGPDEHYGGEGELVDAALQVPEAFTPPPAGPEAEEHVARPWDLSR